jgi:hypothetical protein
MRKKSALQSNMQNAIIISTSSSSLPPPPSSQNTKNQYFYKSETNLVPQTHYVTAASKIQRQHIRDR